MGEIAARLAVERVTAKTPEDFAEHLEKGAYCCALLFLPSPDAAALRLIQDAHESGVSQVCVFLTAEEPQLEAAFAAGANDLFLLPALKGLLEAKLRATVLRFSEAEKLKASTAALEQRVAERSGALGKVLQRQQFLLDASNTLAETLNIETTLDRVAGLAVPQFAHWCAVDLWEPEKRQINQVAVAHPSPEKAELVRELERLYPRSADDPGGAAKVIRTGEADLISDVTDEMIVGAALDPHHLVLLRGLELCSFVSVPLLARGNVLGALTLASISEDLRYTEDDMPFILEVARRAAQAIDNSRLYRQLEEELVERRRVEAALRETDERFSSIINNTTAAIQLKDSSGRYMVVNRQWEIITGRSSADVLGKTPHDVFTPEVAERLLAHDQKVLQENAAISYEESATFPDGVHTFISIKFPLRDAAGVPYAVGGVSTDITERKQSEDAIRLSEHRFRALATMSAPIVWSTREGEELGGNLAWQDLTGQSAADANDFGWSHALHPDDRRHAFEEWDKATASQGVFEIEYRIRTRDRGFRWFAARATPVLESDGSVREYVGTLTDIHSRRKDEERTRFLSSLHQALISVTDPDEAVLLSARMLGEHLEVDRCAYAEVGADQDSFFIPADYTRPGTSSIVGHFTFAAFGDDVLRLMREGKPYVVSDIEKDPQRPEDLSPYRTTGIVGVICVSLLKEGRFVAAMAVHQHHPRVWTEAEVELVQTVANRCWESIERARVARILRESEEKFRALADNISQLAWMTDETGSAFWYNRRWYEYTGITPEQVEGIGWESVHSPEHLDRVAANFQASLQAGTPWEDTFPLRRYDGAWRWFLSHARPIRDPAGKVVRWFGTNTDVTEQREAEERLAQLNEELAQARDEALAASHAKSLFLANMSHELRTPLNAILGYAELIREEAEENNQERTVADLNKVILSGQHLLAVIGDILDLSKIEAGRMELMLEEVDALEVARESVSLAAPLAERNGNSLEVACAERGIIAVADRTRLRQVMFNLLANAAKFTERGAIQVGCRTLPDPQDATRTRVELTVQDNGIGMTEEQIGRLFRPFEQLDPSPRRRHGGTGLGLAISKRLLEMMGGSISIQSEAGKGSKVFVYLPGKDRGAGSSSLK